MTRPTRLSLEQVHALAWQVLRVHGVSEDHARAIADTITAAERDDCKAHGLFRLLSKLAARPWSNSLASAASQPWR
jgi:delta1-piperideine-2-carboxylate reductase